MDIRPVPVQRLLPKQRLPCCFQGKRSRCGTDERQKAALRLEVLEIHCTKTSVSCAIRKDGGDDPDVTNGILIFAEVTRIPADELAAGENGF